MSRVLRILIAVAGLALGSSVALGSGIIKVLPEFLDLKGRNALSPSLYERDVYQLTLREHPERRSGIRFYVQWKAPKAAWEPLLVRVELRGIAEGRLPRQTSLEQPLPNRGSASSHWVELTLNGAGLQELSELSQPGG